MQQCAADGRPSFFLHLSDHVCLAYDSLLFGPALPHDQPDVYSVLYPAVLQPTARANSFLERGSVIECKTHRDQKERREWKSGLLSLGIPFLSHTQRDSVPPFHLTAKRNQQNHRSGHSLGSKGWGKDKHSCWRDLMHAHVYRCREDAPDVSVCRHKEPL